MKGINIEGMSKEICIAPEKIRQACKTLGCPNKVFCPKESIKELKAICDSFTSDSDGRIEAERNWKIKCCDKILGEAKTKGSLIAAYYIAPPYSDIEDEVIRRLIKFFRN
ncbi:MAG: hypothetical protein ABIH79_01115 [archaeon]